MPTGVYERTAEHRRIISEGQKKRKPLTEAQRRANSERQMGHSVSEETRRKIAEAVTVDGRRGHPSYSRWTMMMHRCHSPKSRIYRYYGGRGIRVCEEWHDPWTFFNYLDRELGPCPSDRTLDRIDVNGNYEPGNVRWATKSEQMKNRRPRIKKLKLRHPEKKVWVIA